jgi:hypothetical protein
MVRLADAGLRPIAARMKVVRLCRHKFRHPTRGAAEAAMRSLVRRERHCPEAGTLNVYRCPRCLAWHVGHRHDAGELG